MYNYNPKHTGGFMNKIEITEIKKDSECSFLVHSIPRDVHKAFKSACARVDQPMFKVIIDMMRWFSREN